MSESMQHQSDIGNSMYQWAVDLFPICRSLTGKGVRQTLNYLQGLLPNLSVHSVPSGTQAFDWTVPDEWEIREAYITDMSGARIVDFCHNNLHVLGYSEPVDKWLELSELEEHLYSLPEQPNAIPYVTSYYSRRWGFCLSHQQRQLLKPGQYHVVIDSTLKPGVLNYGELILPGETEDEVLLSTYICHPSMANNELSGPVVTTALALWLQTLPRRYTYRILFIPETIGSIVYLSLHHEVMQQRVKAGYVVTCVGDDRAYSYLPSRHNDTLSDRAARHVMKQMIGNYNQYSFLDRGSDERQYCAPGIDLPIGSIMRSKYGCYPEYHTSLDNLDFISPSGLYGAYDVLKHTLSLIENNRTWLVTNLCEPQLGKRGLYPSISTKSSGESVKTMMDLLAYADGTKDLISLAECINANALECTTIMEKLAAANLVRDISQT